MLENPEQLEQELKAVRELAGLVELALQQARRLACVVGAVHGFQRAAQGRKEGGRGRIGARKVFHVLNVFGWCFAVYRFGTVLLVLNLIASIQVFCW